MLVGLDLIGLSYQYLQVIDSDYALCNIHNEIKRVRDTIAKSKNRF